MKNSERKELISLCNKFCKERVHLGICGGPDGCLPDCPMRNAVQMVKSTVCKNTRVDYLYRDASNYKVHNTAVVSGTITDEQVKDIFAALSDGEFFIPAKVGLPEIDLVSLGYAPNEDDTDLFVLTSIGVDDSDPTIDMTADELYAAFLLIGPDGWEVSLV